MCQFHVFSLQLPLTRTLKEQLLEERRLLSHLDRDRDLLDRSKDALRNQKNRLVLTLYAAIALKTPYKISGNVPFQLSYVHTYSPNKLLSL